MWIRNQWLLFLGRHEANRGHHFEVAPQYAKTNTTWLSLLFWCGQSRRSRGHGDRMGRLLWQCWSSCGTRGWKMLEGTRKALGKIFALGVLGDHGYGESLTKRFDFCPRCYYLARCYAYVWVLCCWGHLSNGIRMRLLWIRMLALTCSSFEVKSGAAMHLTVIQISVLVPTFFAWWGAPLVECYPQVAMCNCLWLVLGIERLHCSSCCKWCSSMYFDSLSWLAATWCNFAWYSRLPWVNDYAIFGCVPSLDGWVDVNLSRCFSGNMLFPCKSVVENPLLLCQYGIASRPGGVSDYVGVQVMDSTFALSLEDMFHLDKRSHEHHGWSSRTRSRGHRVLPSP